MILKKIFRLQYEFQIQLGNKKYINFKNIKSKNNINILKDQLLGLIVEASEALQELPWKSWKQNQLFSISKFKIELIDILHFLINLFIFTGMNEKEVFYIFKIKNKINKERQKNGY